MTRTLPARCPRCDTTLEPGFAAQVAGPSFVTDEKLDHDLFVDEDLSGTGVLRKFLPSPAAYDHAALCRSCQLDLVDSNQTLSRPEAEQVADPSKVPG